MAAAATTAATATAAAAAAAVAVAHMRPGSASLYARLVDLTLGSLYTRIRFRCVYPASLFEIQHNLAKNVQPDTPNSQQSYYWQVPPPTTTTGLSAVCVERDEQTWPKKMPNHTR